MYILQIKYKTRIFIHTHVQKQLIKPLTDIIIIQSFLLVKEHVNAFKHEYFEMNLFWRDMQAYNY